MPGTVRSKYARPLRNSARNRALDVASPGREDLRGDAFRLQGPDCAITERGPGLAQFEKDKDKLYFSGEESAGAWRRFRLDKLRGWPDILVATSNSLKNYQ